MTTAPSEANPPKPADLQPIVIFNNVSRQFVGHKSLFSRSPPPIVRAVDDVSFSVARATCFAIVGESGSGKSTLARLLVGLLQPTAGEVIVDGVALSSLDSRELRALRRRVQLVLQDPRASLDPRMTTLETLTEALDVHELYPDHTARRERINAVIAMVGLAPAHLSRYAHELSGGQRQRVAIARAIICEPEILVLDEPVSALDVSVQAQIINLLAELKTQLGLTYIVITHDLSLVAHMADTVGVMYLGRFVEHGSVEAVCDTPHHPYTQGLMEIAELHTPRAGEGNATMLEGSIPSPLAIPTGCSFHTRCKLAKQFADTVDSIDTEEGRLPRRCVTDRPEPQPTERGGALASCHFAGAQPPARKP